jgi:hypothetical protein
VTSPSLGAAVRSPTPAWTAPQVYADWRSKGSFQVGSIDDLSDQAGNDFTVTHSIDDGLPDTVTATGSADASGKLSLPNVLGRDRDNLNAITYTSADTTFRDSTSVGGSSTHGQISNSSITQLDCDLVWISWRATTKGAGNAPKLTLLPAGYTILVDQTTDGDLNAILLMNNHPFNVLPAQPLLDFYFSQPVEWAAGFIHLNARARVGLGYMPVNIPNAASIVPASFATNHATPSLATGSTGSSGGVPIGLYINYGPSAAGAWVQVSNGVQFSNASAVTGGVSRFNSAMVVNGPSGPATTYTPGLGTFGTSAATTLPSGPSIASADGDFNSMTGWTPTNATFAQSTTHARVGTNAGLLTVTGTPVSAQFRSPDVASVVPNNAFRASGWVFITASTPNVTISIDWYTAAHALISTSTAGLITVPANTWTYIDTGVVQAPALAAFAQYGGTISGSPATGKQLWWDTVDFRGSESILFGLSVEGAEWGDLDGRQYFSDYNPDSPVSTFPRDTAPMSLSQGIITDDGPQYTPLFKGQMSSVVISGRSADIEAASASRLALMQNVPLPMINGQTQGCNMTWPVTHSLAWCGFYAAPAPTEWARAYFSFHGSNYPNMAGPAPGAPQPLIVTRYSDQDVAQAGGGVGQIDNFQPTDVPGPFVLGMFNARTAMSGTFTQITYTPYAGYWNPYNADYRASGHFSPSVEYAECMTQAGPVGRFSIWLRGDSAIVNPTLWGITQFAGSFGGLFSHRVTLADSVGTALCYVEMGILGDGRNYTVLKDNSGHTTSNFSGDPLPFDGQWHFFSWSWNLNTGAILYQTDDGSFSPALATFDVTDLPLTEAAWAAAGGTIFGQIDAYLPVAEGMLECDYDSTLYNNDFVWRPEIFATGATKNFVPSAIVRPLDMHLNAVTEVAPVPAWDLIVRYAQASLSAYRCDELDRPCFLPLTYFGEPVYQEVALDNFTTRVVANGWGTISGPEALAWTTNPAADTSVSGGLGNMLIPSVGTNVEAALLDVNEIDVDIRTYVRPAVNAAGGPVEFDVRLRYVDATHYIACRLSFQTDLSVDVIIVANYGAGEVTLASNLATALTYNSGQYIWLYARAYGSIIQMKAFNAQNIEPSAWTLTATDTLPSSGYVAVDGIARAGNTNTPFTALWDAFRVRAEDIETIDTEVNAQDLDITSDPSRIRTRRPAGADPAEPALQQPDLFAGGSRHILFGRALDLCQHQG